MRKENNYASNAYMYDSRSYVFLDGYKMKII